MAERERQGSAHCFEVVVERDVMLTMRDGVRLATDIYRPARAGASVAGRFPSFSNARPTTSSRHARVQPRLFAEHGYVVVLQDVRGRGRSEGEWYPFAREAPDGFDTIEWVAGQPWCPAKSARSGPRTAAATRPRWQRSIRRRSRRSSSARACQTITPAPCARAARWSCDS